MWREEGPTTAKRSAGSVVVSAFPSAGLASIVAAHYVVRALKLPRIGRFESPDLPPIAVVQGGEVSPMVRAYGRPDLDLVLSEFPPTPSQANALARTILDHAEQHGARLILCLEGVVPHPINAEGEPEEGEAIAAVDEKAPEQVWVAFARKDPALLASFEPSGARVLEDGVIGGVSGALLVQAIGRPVPVAVLLVSARVAGGLPDHRAGAALIEAVDRLLPEVRIDTGPLRAQAEQIEKALRQALKTRVSAQPPTADAPAPPSPEMYQ